MTNGELPDRLVARARKPTPSIDAMLASMSTPIHDTAATGFALGADAYARGRPDYPVALDAWLRDAVGLGPGKVAIDLASGTGKFIDRLASTGARVIAIEPVAAMRARAAADHPEATVLEGTAASMPLDDASADAVVCAQAFHWFANAIALAEIHRVLRPGGVLALVWNVRDESVPWVRRMTDILAPHEGDTPRYVGGKWRDAFPAEGFGPLEETRFAHVHRGPVEQVLVDRALSVSFIAALDTVRRAEVRDQLFALAASDPQLAGRAIVDFPYETHAYRAMRLG